MRIHDLALVNFCQHRYRQLAFSEGLNLLVGPNGSGKSNILRALQFALTGDAGGDRNKLDDIAQGIGADGHSEVSCTLSHADATMHIRRGLKPNTNRLEVVGGVTKTNVTEINNELWTRLGTTKKQIVDYVFVGQRKVDEMFDQKPADRAASLAALFGLQHAAAVYKQTGDFINSIEVPTTLLDEDALTRRLGELDTSDIDADLEVLREAIAADKPRLDAAKADLQQWAIYRASLQARQIAERNKAAFEAKPKPDATPPAEPALTEHEEDLLDTIAERVAHLRQSLQQIKDGVRECKTCGQLLPGAADAEERRRTLQDNLDAACKTAAPLEHREQLWEEHARALIRVETWEAERDRVNAAMDALKSCDPPATPHADLLKIVADYDAMAEDIKTLAATRRNMLADRQRVEQQLAEFRQVRERSARTREAIAELTAMRQVFHHDEAPRMVSYTYVESMLEEINETLEIFDAPYRVVMDENLGFIAHFTDGVRIQPDRRLSVGERIILALAFRITVNSTFAGQVGLLVMDEPTAGFDEHNLGCLPHALNRLKELSEERGLQVLFVTHEPQITNIFDNVIELPVAQI